MISKCATFVVVLTLVLVSVPTLAQVPQLINYQGRIDEGGVPVTGTRDLAFAVYATASGGSAIWSETQTGVQVTGGVFNVLLGSVTPIPLSLFSGTATRFLGVTVGAGSELTPRYRLSSVPFAMSAARADTAEEVSYTSPRTGYISGSMWALGKPLYSTGSWTYSGGIYNNGAGSDWYMVPLNLPHGVTLTAVTIYGSDADAATQMRYDVLREVRNQGFSSALGSATTGIAFASGDYACTVALSPGSVIDNSQYGYSLQINLPNTANVRIYTFVATYTFTQPSAMTTGQPADVGSGIYGVPVATPDSPTSQER